MSAVDELIQDAEEQAEARFAHVAKRKGWVCRACGDTPSKDELDYFLDNDYTHPHCDAAYRRFMRD